jgi:predicted DsbA family dithiol-disulfide isomerase
MDRVMELTPSNNGLDAAKLPEIAEYVGLNRSKFESCLASGKFAEKIQAQFANATQSGFRGTPYSVIVVKGTPAQSLPGALPFTLKDDPSGQKGVKEILDELLGGL